MVYRGNRRVYKGCTIHDEAMYMGDQGAHVGLEDGLSELALRAQYY